jgi:hypothetical protein
MYGRGAVNYRVITRYHGLLPNKNSSQVGDIRQPTSGKAHFRGRLPAAVNVFTAAWLAT